MNIACLNLGYSIMSNIISGSEAPFVKICQNTYPDYKGWSNSTKNISMCTFNAVQFLSDYDVFGVQEVNNKYKDVFMDSVRLSRMDKRFEFLSSNYHNDSTCIMVGYDRDKLGKGVQLTKDLKLSSPTDDRTIQIIWFEKVGLLFINLHAPHHINLKLSIERICNNITLPDKPDNIIMVGDFNDASGQLINKYINICGRKLRIPNSFQSTDSQFIENMPSFLSERYSDKKIQPPPPNDKRFIKSYPPKTCCADTNYEYVGDYILTTDYNNKDIYFGLPLDFDRNTNLYSDHDPVVLLLH
jgi:hypothetical protein